MNNLIGLTGKARSGKSTVAEFLRHMYGYHEDSFAAPIRQFICHTLGLTPDALEQYKEEQIDGFEHTPRYMMQTVGTEWGRQMIQDDLWVASLKRRIARVNKPYIVISDVRFENEAAAIRELGGQIWHIHRTDNTTAHTHTSEAGIVQQPGDMVIVNDGQSRSALYRKVNELLRG